VNEHSTEKSRKSKTHKQPSLLSYILWTFFKQIHNRYLDFDFILEYNCTPNLGVHMSAYIENTALPEKSTNLHRKISSLLARTLTNKESFSAYFEPFFQLFKPEWRYNQISAKVISKRNENHKIYTLTLKPDSRWQTFKAGQYVMLSVEINGRFLTRTFSISSSPREFERTGLIQISICELPNGTVTPWLKGELKAGDTVYLSQAQGEFCLNIQDTKLFIAGGSGITPIRSMLKESKHAPWLKQAHLLFYQDTPDESIFTEDLAQLKEAGLNIHLFYSKMDGFISLEHVRKALNLTNIPDADFFQRTEAYICGPAPMIASSTEILKQAGLEEAFIHYEYFGRAPTSSLAQMHRDNQADEVIQVDYLTSGKQVQFNAGSISKSLLELAEEQGLKPVSGCRIGICHQCICKKKTGRVLNTKTREISDSGPEDIQLCLSVPLDSVVLEL
jgi:ferredoxin-NADP reductase